MRISEVSRRYSRALYETARPTKRRIRFFLNFAFYRRRLHLARLSEFLVSPIVSQAQKTEVLKKSLSAKVSDELLNFMLLLATKRRLSLFKEISNAFEAIIDEERGVCSRACSLCRSLIAGGKNKNGRGNKSNK